MFTNTPPVDAYRGAGVPESIFAIERLIDIAAGELGVDPLELRRRNLLKPEHFPWSTPAGYAIDSGDFAGAMDRALEFADWQGFEARREASAARGLHRGRGLSMSIHGTGAGTSETALVTAEGDGRVTIFSGVQSGGQGHDAMLAEVAAEVIGIDAGLIDVRQGDSDSPAARRRHRRIGKPGGRRAGRRCRLGADAGDGTAKSRRPARMLAGGYRLYEAGVFTVSGTNRSIALVEVAAKVEGGCTGSGDFEGDHRTYPNGVYVSEVEVDPETGHIALASLCAVDDVGRVLDLARTDGQIMGAIAQGVGQALLEHDRHDPETGQPLSGSFMDYAMPRADDLPSFRLAKHPTPGTDQSAGHQGGRVRSAPSARLPR